MENHRIKALSYDTIINLWLYLLFNVLKTLWNPFILWFDHFSYSRTEICQNFRCFFGKLKKSKRHSEINWPLGAELDFWYDWSRAEIITFVLGFRSFVFILGFWAVLHGYINRYNLIICGHKKITFMWFENSPWLNSSYHFAAQEKV